MMRKLAGSIGGLGRRAPKATRSLKCSTGALTLLWAASVFAGGCTPAERNFASGGAGGAGGAGGGCPAGFTECDGDPTTVCETDTATSLAHCGTCDNACAAAVDANIACVAGTCSIASCNNEHENCDNFYDNGCETSPTTSFDHCGKCGNSCEAPNAITACVAGGCQLAQCVMGKLDCDKDPQTGCEVDPATNVDHCGACGMACTSPNATMTCMDSMCMFAACNQNFGDCNQNPADGCEADLLSDPHHCTACGMSCNGGACKAGVCNTPILVAKSSFPPSKMAIFKDVIYYGSRASAGEFASVPVTGGMPLMLSSTPGATNAVVVSSDGIFVAGAQGTMRMNLDGSNKFTWGNQTARGIAVTTSEVYWTANSLIRKSTLLTPNITTNVTFTSTTAFGLFIDTNDTMYWTLSDGSVWYSPIGMFAPKQITIGANAANNVVPDAKFVYWSSAKGVHWAPIGGGSPVDLASASSVRSVAIDATYVYWTEETTGLVQRIVKDGSLPAEILALDQMGPYGLALDAQFVYWSNSNSGDIWKLPK